MANCPRCGTADFYPSFSGKGECLQPSCELFSKEHFAKTVNTTADIANEPLKCSTHLDAELADANRSVWTHPNRSVHPTTTIPGAVPYTPEDSDDYDLTLREVTVAVGALATHMSGYIVPIAVCKSIAKQFTDNVGIPLHTYLYAMPQAMPKALRVWFLGAERTLRAERQPGRRCITFSITG